MNEARDGATAGDGAHLEGDPVPDGHEVPPERSGHGEHRGHESHEDHKKHKEHKEHKERVTHKGHEGHGAREKHGGHDGHGGHDVHAGHGAEMFRRRFCLSLALTIPTIVWGHMLTDFTGFVPPAFPGSRWISPLFGTAVFVYGGLVFLRGAGDELRSRRPGMMTLISLAIVVAFVFSAAVTLGYPGTPLWEELATLVTIMLLGHWIEMRSISRATGALNELARLLPDTAERIVDGSIERVTVAALEEGDRVLIRPGASVPADGEVLEGRGSIDESVITGESRPIEKRPGDRVIAGTVNGTGSLRVRVTGTGDRTALAGIMRLVESAQTSRSRAQALADRAAFWLTLIAIGAGGITLAAWLLLGAEASFAIERLVAVLVVACPHALGLAVPLVVAISTTIGAKGGLLVRDRRGLEEARLLDTVVFDKTGTLTLGEHRVVGIVTLEKLPGEEALRLAAAVERDSEHPVARAVMASAREKGVSPPVATGFEAIPGQGVRAVVEGRELQVGGPNLLAAIRARPGPALGRFADETAARGQGTIYLVEGDRVLAALAVADANRPESAEAVRALRRMGIEVVMLTGDARAVAEGVAKELGIDTVLAEVLPDRKAATIESLRSKGKRVAMVGDGVNDAPALVTADVGVAIGAGTDVAVEAGDVVLVRDDPRGVARIIELSRATYRKMVQNLWWAAGYNIVAIPLAAGVLYPWGFVLDPALAAILMSASTVIVALNAQLLRRVIIE